MFIVLCFWLSQTYHTLHIMEEFFVGREYYIYLMTTDKKKRNAPNWAKSIYKYKGMEKLQHTY